VSLTSRASPRSLNNTDFELIAESIPHIVWMAAPDGSTQYFNGRGAEYTGLPAEASYGWGWVSLVHPDDAERARQAWEHAIATQMPYELECRIRRHDGAYRWHECRSLPVRDGDGDVVRWIGTVTDIDDRKRFEDALVRSERAAAESLTLLETLEATAPVGLGFVDRDCRLVRINKMLADINGGPLEQQLGCTVAEVVPAARAQVDPVFRRVLDTGEAVANVEVSGSTAADPGRVHHWLASYSPVRVDDEIIGIGVIVVDITERYEADKARDELMHTAVAAIAATVDARDPYTAGHQRRVADICAAIALEVGLDPHEVDGIRLAASIHDIGKIGVPAEILTRPGKLRPAELELVKTHPRAGSEIVAGIAFPWPVAQMILQHHERLDGSGYPDGARDGDILLGARIIAVADTVEAMASHRPYRPARGVAAALDDIKDGRGTRYDPQIVDACLRLFQQGRLPLHEPG
jgi:PAS domain S-box-containing protein